MPVNLFERAVLGSSMLFIAAGAPAQSKFEDLPPSAQLRWTKPIPAAPKPLRPEAPMILAPQTPNEGGIQNPYFSECVFYDDFSFFTPQPDDVGEPPMLVPLQDGLLGVTWSTGRDFIGMANDALFTALGGTPPMGLTPNGDPIERYIAFARETLDSGPIPSMSVGMEARAISLLLFGPQHPMRLTQFVYLQTDDGVPDTNVWWSPMSFLGGGINDRVTFGGVFETGPLSHLTNEDGVLDRFVSIGCITPFCIQTMFASAEHPNFGVPVDQWFMVSHIIVSNPGGGIGRGTWVKSHDTMNAIPPFLDPRMASGDIAPPDGDPVGWVCTYPGWNDDPATPDVIEGIGLATDGFGSTPNTQGAFGLDGDSFTTLVTDGIQYGIGLDPALDEEHSVNDVFFGPLCMTGAIHETPCVLPDFTLPYQDSLEAYNSGQPIRIQTTRWFDAISSNAIISTVQNTTPGGFKSIAQQNVNNDSLFRREFGTAVPSNAVATLGHPMIASVNMRMAPTHRTSRAFVLNDAKGDGAISAMVLLGGSDPTSVFFQSDARLYVRQPNPSFDPLQPAQDHLVEMNWIDPSAWQIPPDPPLNLRHTLIPTGVAYQAGIFREVRIEIEPQSLDPDDPPLMRVHFGEQEVFPHGDPRQSWIAMSRSASSIEFWSGNQALGQFDILHVDDVTLEGAKRIPVSEPPFLTPYLATFGEYAFAESVHGQGGTPFLNPESVPGPLETQDQRPISIVVNTSAAPLEGEPVCRYEILDVCEEEHDVLPEVGRVIAIQPSSLPPTASGAPIGCQGALAFQFDPGFIFEVRTQDGESRVGVGRWSLMNDGPTPFDPSAGDVTKFDFHYEYEPVWRIATPRNQGLVAADPTGGMNPVLRVENPGGVTDTDGQSELFESVDALLPRVVAAPEDFPTAMTEIELAFDLFIESVDVDGNPVITPPRSRLALTVDGVTPAMNDRITEFVFGGPNLPGGIPAENLAYLNADRDFVDSGFSLISPTAPFSGPLLNSWVRVIVEINNVGDWRLLIDEDRDGPAPAHEVTAGEAIDGANLVMNDMVRVNAFRLRQGRDYGGGGEPMTPPRNVRIRTGGATSIGPPDADPNDDYCFYEISHEAMISATDPPQIAEVTSDFDGEVIGLRELATGDVLAVLNRRTNPDNTIAGNPRVHELCPTLPFDEIESFKLFSESGAEVAYEGRWKSMGLVGLPGEDLPPPAGGLTRPDGPVQDPPVSYNDPTQEPPGYPQPFVARPIFLADWTMDADNGAAPSEPPLPRSRWYVDNVSLREITIGAPCADLGGKPDVVDGADLAQLLSQWGRPNPPHDINFHESDFNGDGIVNGADLATLLANWGPCP